jgi:hypothetical protein
MKGKENSKLSPRQLQILPHLLASPSYEEAARRSGISAKQIYSWLKQPRFLDELKKLRHNVFCNALLLLKLSTQKAAETLLLLLDNDDPRIRLIASEKILVNAFKGFELYEIEERISSLETMINKPSSEQR